MMKHQLFIVDIDVSKHHFQYDETSIVYVNAVDWCLNTMLNMMVKHELFIVDIDVFKHHVLIWWTINCLCKCCWLMFKHHVEYDGETWIVYCWYWCI